MWFSIYFIETEKERSTEDKSKPTSQEERLKFIKSNASAQEQLRKAIEDLNKVNIIENNFLHYLFLVPQNTIIPVKKIITTY